MSRTVLVLAPHPDDAEIFAGGTIAKMIAEGARALIVIASSGNKGSFEHDAETLAAIRREEAIRAAAVLGAEPPIFLEHPDLEVDLLPPGVLREQFVRLIRQYKPDIVIAEDPLYIAEVHPDHRAVARAASDAVNFCHLPLFHPEHKDEGLEPHFVVEKYFYTPDPASANKIVDITDTIEKKIAAMLEHKSQVQFLVEEVLRQARLAGLDPRAMLGPMVEDPAAAMAWALRMEAAQIGGRAGFAYGEAFRYVRFHPIVETLLAGQA
ncbi:MAG: PIG-L deacetylase family protein [Anaerolineae bacterium]|nr:PIG-L family deacetylase [Anaerolineae bacterium]MDW7992809.1 PIG-L deacetylase family protein [Anaerolineae bacterium]